MYINNHNECYFSHLNFLNEPNEVIDYLFKAMPFGDQVKLLGNFYDEDKTASIERLWSLCDERVKKKILWVLMKVRDEKAIALLQNLFDRSDEKLQCETLGCALIRDSLLFSLLWEKTPSHVKKKLPDIENLLFFAIKHNKYLAMTLIFQDASIEMQINGLKCADDGVFPKLWAMASQEAKDYCYLPGLTWFFRAILAGKKGTVQFLLKEGFNVRTVLENGITPYLSALEKVDSLGESIVDDIRKKDAGYSDDMVKCRLFGHRFELAGHYFEGTPYRKLEWIIDSIIKTTRELTVDSRYQRSFSSSHVDNLVEAFTLSTKDSDQLYSRSRTKATLVNASWNHHAVTAIFTPTICAKINTGTGDKRGISFYKIKTIDQERVKNVIKRLKDNIECTEVEGQKYFDETMHTELDLEFVDYVWSNQIVGNCGYMANKCSLLALIIFQQMTGMKDFNARQLKTSYSEVHSDFVHWESVDLCKSISETLPILKKYPEYFDFNEIMSKIIINSVAKHEDDVLIALVRAEPSLKDWKNPTFRWPLSRYALYYRNIKLFVYLVKLGVDFSRVDTTGKSIYDDLKQFPLAEEETQLIKAELQDQPLNEEAKKFLQHIAKELPKNPL